LRHLEQEARAIFDRAAVLVRALLGPVLQELIGQVAVGTVNLDAIETCTQRAFGTGSELLDDARELMQFEGARDRERRFAITFATSPEVALLDSATRSWSTIRSSSLSVVVRCPPALQRFTSSNVD
jgi:hypothetical protein